MIKLHFWPTPNGHKLLLALEEFGIPSCDIDGQAMQLGNNRTMIFGVARLVSYVSWSSPFTVSVALWPMRWACVQFCGVVAQHHGMSSSMRACGQPSTRRARRSAR